MDLPKVITDLVESQNRRNSVDFVKCFTDNASVIDENKTHKGRKQIKSWMEETTKQHNMIMKPISFVGNNLSGLFKTEVSGTFPGSPIVFNYLLEFDGDLIRSLEITT